MSVYRRRLQQNPTVVGEALDADDLIRLASKENTRKSSIFTDRKPPSAARSALVVDDHPLVARGFAEYLSTHCGFNTVHIAMNAGDCFRHIENDGPPDLAVVDFWLPDGAAPKLILRLTEQCKNTRILVVSGDNNELVQAKAQQAGAHGFLHKQESPDVFAQAVMALCTGNSWLSSPTSQQYSVGTLPHSTHDARSLDLTERQQQVLSMMLRGLPNKRIAHQLNISEQTVKEHVTAVLGKFGARNRVELITQMQGRRIDG